MRNFSHEPIHDFTAEEMERLRSIIERTYQSIADDICMDEDTEDEMHRYDVTELALDADRWKWSGNVEEKDEQIVGHLRMLGYMSKEWKEVIDRTLPYEYYEV